MITDKQVEEGLNLLRQLVANTTRPNARRQGVKPPEGYTEGFLTFWAAYPRKEKKRKAFEAWVAKNPPIGVVGAVTAYAYREQKTERRYLLLPASWINAESWLDEDSRPIQAEKPKCQFCGDDATFTQDGVGSRCSKPNCQIKFEAKRQAV